MIFLSLRFYVKSIYSISRCEKSAIFTHLEALNCDFYEFLHYLKAEIDQKLKFRVSKVAKNSIF